MFEVDIESSRCVMDHVLDLLMIHSDRVLLIANPLNLLEGVKKVLKEHSELLVGVLVY